DATEPPSHTQPGSGNDAASASQPSTPERKQDDDSKPAENDATSRKNKKERRRGRGTLALALIALLIALLAAAAVAALGWLGKQRLASVHAELSHTQQALHGKVEGLLPRLHGLDARLATVEQGLTDARKQSSAIHKQLHRNQEQIAETADLVEGGARRWSLLAIESLLLAANERLLLYHNPEAAGQALQLASHRLAELNDPRLFKIHKQVVNEIATIEALPDPDIQSLALALAALIQKVPELTLASRVPANYQNAAGAQTRGDAAAQTSLWQHFVDSLADALQGMFTIRHTTAAYQPLMPPKQEFFLYQNLMLKLQTARLALLQSRGEVFHASLKAALDWLQGFFAGDDPAVAAMIDKIGKIEKTRIAWDSPDITTSLTLLRAYLGNPRDAKRRSANADKAPSAPAPE
ncbi:MAG: uroporphyrinogen-III C-methyltransferase, partial [Salinisphaera sp.]|nr:uroporphyrinogen-III C-methyltransferase [Salinisphaera sp.]